MAIDDPVGVVLKQWQDDAENSSSVQNQMIQGGRLVLSAAVAATLAPHPFASQILSSIISNTPAYVEKRLLVVLEEFDRQQKRLEAQIPNKSYYLSEEFQTLFLLIRERLATTHQIAKLKRFGVALANSALGEFSTDQSEVFTRVLRDMSLLDVGTLAQDYLKVDITKRVVPSRDLGEDDLASLARLVSFGLVYDTYVPTFDEHGGLGAQRQESNYMLSAFGKQFLKFISDSTH